MSNPNAIRLDSVSKSFDGFKALSEALKIEQERRGNL